LSDIQSFYREGAKRAKYAKMADVFFNAFAPFAFFAPSR